MKKLLSLLLIFSLSCGSTMPLIGCDNIANNKPYLPPAKPKKPIIKDIFYYEKLKKEITAEIKEYDEVIKEIKNSKNWLWKRRRLSNRIKTNPSRKIYQNIWTK